MVTQNSQECCHALKVHCHLSGEVGTWEQRTSFVNTEHIVGGALVHGCKGRDLIGPLHLELRKVSSN